MIFVTIYGANYVTLATYLRSLYTLHAKLYNIYIYPETLDRCLTLFIFSYACIDAMFV